MAPAGPVLSLVLVHGKFVMEFYHGKHWKLDMIHCDTVNDVALALPLGRCIIRDEIYIYIRVGMIDEIYIYIRVGMMEIDQSSFTSVLSVSISPTRI